MTTSNYPDVALRLSMLEDRFAICRLEPGSEVPGWATEAGFFSVTRTPNELSIVCPEPYVPDKVTREDGWRALVVEGPLDFSLVGVLASITTPLAEAGISVFIISTYDTDCVLVREDALETVTAVLRESGHELLDSPLNILVRPATVEDGLFLWEMLYEAVHWIPEEAGPKPPPEALLSRFGLRRYLEGWGRENDFAVVALDSRNGSRIGATWHRTFPVNDPGYGFVDEATPEIVLAVVPDRRGIGVGGALLHSLIETASSSGFEAISLAVRKSNRAAIKLYEKSGFIRLGDDGSAWIMKVDLSAKQTINHA